jgi:hypothetical protein
MSYASCVWFGTAKGGIDVAVATRVFSRNSNDNTNRLLLLSVTVVFNQPRVGRHSSKLQPPVYIHFRICISYFKIFGQCSLLLPPREKTDDTIAAAIQN